jgi:hypothetical protein
MRCEVARRSVGEAMDDRRSLPAETDAHLLGCPACSAFARGAWRVRELSRFELAPPVPDLVPAIMARIDAQRRLPTRGFPPASRVRSAGPPRAARRLTPWLGRQGAAVAAVAAGLVIGFVLSSGAIIPDRRTNTAALADEIPRHLVRAAEALSGYQATYDITELNWTAEVPVRTFVAKLSFLAPEAFRASVRDTTAYPSRAWPRNNLLLVTDGRAWLASGPNPCPQAALPECPPSSRMERSVANRAPFDSQTRMPTDVIVPMTVLAAAARVEVVASGQVAGTEALAVELDYQDATPLFASLQFLGSWRPFFPQDRVVVWLDAETWLPLRYEVLPAPGAERATWASQAGLPAEATETPVFVAEARTVSTVLPSPALFDPGPGPEPADQGFRETPVEELPGVVRPEGTQGLTLWRAGRFDRTAARPYDLSILAYTRGLAWLTVTQVRGWNQSQLFGVGPFAEEVTLGSAGGVGYYEPATGTEARRVAVHTTEGEFLLATNLPRAALLSVAGSLPVGGVAVPGEWRIHRGSNAVVEIGLSPEEAVERAGFEVLLPSFLPPGYRAASAMTVETAGATGIAINYRRPAAELGGTGLRLYQSHGEALPPPTGADEQIVQVGGTMGRWSPEAHVLDWIDEHGVYRSLSGPGFDLTSLLEVATSLRPAEEASS